MCETNEKVGFVFTQVQGLGQYNFGLKKKEYTYVYGARNKLIRNKCLAFLL